MATRRAASTSGRTYGTWTDQDPTGASTSGDTTANWVQQTGIAAFSDWTLASPAVTNVAPASPTNLAQFKSDTTTAIAVGGSTNETGVVLKGDVSDPDLADTVKLEVEVKPVGTASDGTTGLTSGTLDPNGTDSVTVSGLVNGTSYHWRARAVDASGATSAWVSFPTPVANAESVADFSIDSSAPSLSSVSIVSANANPALAKVGDTVTVSFTANENLQTPSVTIAGHAATVSGANDTWSATWVMAGGDSEGLVAFSIGFSDQAGNAGTAVSATTDASSVTFDKSAPSRAR